MSLFPRTLRSETAVKHLEIDLFLLEATSLGAVNRERRNLVAEVQAGDTRLLLGHEVVSAAKLRRC